MSENTSASIFDLVQASNTVDLRGKKIPVYGISLNGLFFLSERYPILKRMLGMKMADLSELDPEKIMQMAPEAITTIIAVGVTDVTRFEHAEKDGKYIGEISRASKSAGAFSIGEQVKVVGEIIKATLPEGVDPFKQQLKEITGAFNSGSEAMLDRTGSEANLQQATPSGGRLSAILQTEDLPGPRSAHLRRVG